MVLIFLLCGSFLVCLGWGWKLVPLFPSILPFIPTMCVYGILKVTHGEAERTAETKTLDRSCRSLKRSSWVLFHPSNTVSLCKIKTVSYKTILNPFYTLALPVLKSRCEVYILNACPCTHTLNIHSEFTVLCFYSPTAGPYGKTTTGASCKGEEWGGAAYAGLALIWRCPWGAWAALKPLTELKSLLPLPFQRESHGGNNRQIHSLPLRGRCILHLLGPFLLNLVLWVELRGKHLCRENLYQLTKKYMVEGVILLLLNSEKESTV